MKKWTIWFAATFLILGCSRETIRNQREAQAFIDSLSNILEPLQTTTMQVYWEATSTGNDSLFRQYSDYEVRLMKVYNNSAAFQKIKQFSSQEIKDPILARQVKIVYNEFLINQVDTIAQKQIAELYGGLFSKFQRHSYKIDNAEVPVSKLREVLRKSENSVERQKAWEALKKVGPDVADDFLKMVRLLNESARSIGFRNYYEQKLITQEEDPRVIEELVQKYSDGTAEPYRIIKAKIDSALAVKYKVRPSDLQPWHYMDPYASDAPFARSYDLDQYYKDKDVVSIAKRFFNGIGFDVTEIIARSDLTERPDKYRQAYCTDISRNGDIRIMANISNNSRGMSILMHEMGHAVHYMSLSRDLPYYLLDLPTPSRLPRDQIYINKELPYLLRDNTHFFIAEGVATFFQNLTTNPDWMEQMLGLTPSQKSEYIAQIREVRPAKALFLSGWMLVMFNFEKALYENPDQDLNKLWWDLIEKYQLIKRPSGRNEPDWACNFHIVILPLYYQNYLLGDVFAAQILHAMAADQGLNSPAELQFVNNPAIGHFLEEKVFSFGKKYRWDELVKKATGEDLSVKYYIEQLKY